MSDYFRLFARVLSAVVAMCVACPEAKAQDREPMTPRAEEVAAHLLGKAPVVRADLSKFPELRSGGAIPVELVVDERGNVTSAKLEDEEEVENDPEIKKLTRAHLEAVRSLIAEAKKAGMQLHFRPFEDGGKPVAAKFEIEIPLRPLNEPPIRHMPFPQIHDWNSLKIVLSRTGCFGFCPSYKVEVHGDGAVLYEGGSFVAITGSHRFSVSGDVVAELIEAFRAADYFSLEGEYRWGATDLPTYTTSISIDGKTKKVVDYAGEHVGMPESVTRLEKDIDHLSGVERWIKGNGETVAALAREKFDFKSPQASEILTNVAEKGNADAVRDLLAAGVTMSTERAQNHRGMPGTALEKAARRGDVEMLRALLGAGTIDSKLKTEALKSAAWDGKMDAIRLLIGSGADPTAPDVLIGAAASGVPAVVQEILKYRPDVNLRGRDGTTAMIACLQAYHNKEKDVNLREVIQMLLEAGADPNIADNEGKTPLIANAWDLEIAKLLIAHGANVNAQAEDGFTALLNAGTVELTRFLLEHGADQFAKTRRGETALDLAKQRNRKEEAALLEAAMAGKKQ